MTQQQQESLLGTVLAVIGFLLIAGVAIWGLSHLLTIAKDTVAPWLNRSQAIVISVPPTATTSVPFTLAWTHTATAPGSYAFLYSCVSGVRFETETQSGTIKIPCGSAYKVASTSITLTPQLTVGSRIATPVSVLFQPSTASQTLGSYASNTKAEGTSVITVVRGESEITSKNAPKKTVGTNAPAPILSSAKEGTMVPTKVTTPADLSVQILSVGVIDSYTGAVINRSPVSPDEVAVVQFDIKNTGGAASGSYRFTVELPTETAYVYYSPTQTSLAPHSHVINTLRFDRYVGGAITVTVDTNDSVRESRENNNDASVNF